MKTIHIISILSLLAVEATAQESKSSISVRDVYIQLGGQTSSTYPVSLSDFNKLAEQSILLKNDFTSYSSAFSNSNINNSVFSVMLGLHFLNKEHNAYRSNPVLRAGLSYFSGESLYYNLYLRNERPADTLISSGTGQVYYLDSVTTENYNMHYQSSQIRLDVSMTYSTNPEARWALYGGFGLTAGTSLNANTYVTYFRQDGMENYTPDSYTHSYKSDNSTFTSETYRNKNNYGFSAYLPMGVDFRIARKNEFWKRIHLCYEMRPGITSTVIPELYTVTTGSMQYSFGTKITW